MGIWVRSGRLSRTMAAGLSYLLFLLAVILSAQEFAMDIIPVSGMNQTITPDVERNWELTVQVQNKDGRRIPGAIVIFMLPPGVGAFVGGVTSLTTVTDNNGLAVARGFHRSKSYTGDFPIRVVASFGGATASISVTETLPKITPPLAKNLVRFGIPAAVVVTGVSLWLTHRSDNATTISLGPGAVAASGR